MSLRSGLGGFLVMMDLRIGQRSLGSWSGSGSGSWSCVDFVRWRICGDK